MHALLDVNVLIALPDAGHLHHGLSREWLTRHLDAGCILNDDRFQPKAW